MSGSIFDIDSYVHTEVTPDDYDSYAPHIVILGDKYHPEEVWEDGIKITYDSEEREYEVIHPKCCQFHIVYDFDDDGDFQSYRVYRCMAQDMIDYEGIESLEDWMTRENGEHEFRAWSQYYPGEYGGEYGAEWDGGLEWVDSK